MAGKKLVSTWSQSSEGLDGHRGRPFVSVQVADRSLEIALSAVVRRAGFSLRPSLSPVDAETIHVTDSCTGLLGRTSVVVVEPLPLTSSISVAALRKGLVAAIVSRKKPDSLVAAVESIGRGLACVAQPVLVSAAALPAFTERQHALLQQLSGPYLKLTGMAQSLGVSVATTKRDLQRLCDCLGVTSYRHLADEARRLGYSPGCLQSSLGLVEVADISWATGAVTE